MVRNSGKRKLYWKKTRSDCHPGSWIHHKIWARDVGIFFPVIGNSGNRKMRNRQMRINQVSVSGVWSHPILTTSSFLPPFLLRFVIWWGYRKSYFKISVKMANVHVNFSLLRQLVFFNLETKNTGFGKVMKKVRDAGFSWKRAEIRDQDKLYSIIMIFLFLYLFNIITFKSI